MSFFRNPEIKRDFVLWSVYALLFCTLGFSLGAAAGFLFLLSTLLMLFSHFLTAYARYCKIRKLSRDLDSVLHSGAHINFTDYREGELAILQSELSKMTVRLREQSEALTRDKLLLTDSIADISHQLRTPLTSMNLMLSRLEDSSTSPERKLRLIKDLEHLVSRIDWLISSLLKISKLDAGTVAFKKEKVFLHTVIRRGAAPLLIPMEVRQQNFTTEIEEDASFTGDLFWATEALGNILKNCMEHTPSGGTVSVQGKENALYTEITVSDTGCGIDPEDLPHLFERFYRGKAAPEQSVGIGLALSRMIIVKQNGTVKAENIPGGGAKFTIRFYKSTV